MAISRPQIAEESGSYQKWKAKTMKSTWKKISAFIQNVHIYLLSCLTIPIKFFVAGNLTGKVRSVGRLENENEN